MRLNSEETGKIQCDCDNVLFLTPRVELFTCSSSTGKCMLVGSLLISVMQLKQQSGWRGETQLV